MISQHLNKLKLELTSPLTAMALTLCRYVKVLKCALLTCLLYFSLNGPVVAKSPIMHPFSLLQAAVTPKVGHYGPFGLLQVFVILKICQYVPFNCYNPLRQLYEHSMLRCDQN